MRGSLRKRGDPGSWEYRLELGEQPAQRCQSCGARRWLERRPLNACPACGGELVNVHERRQRTQGGFRTRKDAQAALDGARVALREGDYVEPSSVTVAEDLALWTTTLEATNLRPSTLRSYRDHVEQHIAPRIGSIPLQKLSPDAIGALYAELLREGRHLQPRKPKKGEKAAEDTRDRSLSPNTVHHVHVTLHKALKDAVKRGRLTRNPADAVEPPQPPRPGEHTGALKTWTSVQLRGFFAATRGDRLYPVWHLLATTGMRRGELLGLRWDDVDLEEARLSVRRSLVAVSYKVHVSEPKTARSRRVVDLDAESVEVLKKQATRQSAEQREWSSAWSDTGYVFTREDGQPLHPDRVSNHFDIAVRDSHLPRITLHGLRHTWATLALQAGVPIKVVSERLGHSSVAFTMQVYQHVLPGMQHAAAELVAAAIRGSDVQAVAQ